MARESAGSVYVSIDGDASPLLAKYAQAEAASRVAGQQIAKGLGAGLQSGVSPILTAAGQTQAAVTQVGAAAVKATPQVAALVTPVAQVAQAANVAAPAAARAATAFTGMGSAAAHSVSEIQATSGALRTLDGNGGIRAAERFIATSLGLGPAMQAIFPIVGAIALSEILFKIGESVMKAADNFLYLRDAEQEAQDVGQKTAEALEKSADHVRDLVVEVLRAKGQLVLAAQEEQFDLGQKFIHLPQIDKDKLSGLAPDDLAKVKSAFANVLPEDLGDRIRDVKHDLSDAVDVMRNAQRNALPLDPISTHIESQSRVAVELLGNAIQILKAKQNEFDAEQTSAQAKITKAQEEEAKKRANAAKQFASEQRTAFKDGWDNMLADQKAAHEISKQEELTFRQNELAAARAAGPALSPVATEVNRQVGTLSQEVRKEDADGSHALAMAQVEYASRLRREAIAELEADGRLMTAAVEKITKEMDAAKHGDAEAAAVGDRAARQASSSATGISNANQRVKALELERDYSQEVVHSRQQQIKYAQQLAAIEQETANNNVLNAQADVAIAQGLNAMTPSAQTLLALQQAQTKEAEAEAAAKGVQLQNEIKIANAKRQAQIGAGLTGIAQGIPGQIGGALAGGITGGNIGQQIKQALTGIGKEMMGDVFKDVIAAIIGNSAVTLANTLATELNTFWLAIKSFVGGLLGFASGGRPAPGVPYVVGENGPEIRIDDGPGVILPNVPSMSMLGSIQHSQSVTASSSSHAVSFGGGIHLHGISSPEAFARALPRVLKARAPNFSPATR